MAFTRCKNGRHFYEESTLTECPQCAPFRSTLPADVAPPPSPVQVEASPGADTFRSPSGPMRTAEAAAPFSARFRPVARLSEGGMGKLYLVEEVLYRRCVALKVMHAHLAGNEELVQQFVREAVITARLEHPHIIPIYEIGTLGDGQIFYTMRHIEGRPFSQLSPAVGLRERLRMLRDAASAVDFAHAQGLWHRDLKPSNILVGRWGDVYVIDWGLVSVVPGRTYKFETPAHPAPSGPSKLQDLFASLPHANPVMSTKERIAPTARATSLEERIAPTARATSLEDHFAFLPHVNPVMFTEERIDLTLSGRLAPGNLLGTPAYMSPEQATGDADRLGVPSDVWAFGVMLFETLTGQHPFPDPPNILALMRRVLTSDIPKPRDLNANAPAEISQLCQQMLARDLGRRLPSLGEMITRINRFLEA